MIACHRRRWPFILSLETPSKHNCKTYWKEYAFWSSQRSVVWASWVTTFKSCFLSLFTTWSRRTLDSFWLWARRKVMHLSLATHYPLSVKACKVHRAVLFFSASTAYHPCMVMLSRGRNFTRKLSGKSWVFLKPWQFSNWLSNSICGHSWDANKQTNKGRSNARLRSSTCIDSIMIYTSSRSASTNHVHKKSALNFLKRTRSTKPSIKISSVWFSISVGKHLGSLICQLNSRIWLIKCFKIEIVYLS